MALTVTCPCGATISADTEADYVAQVQKHSKEVHNQEVTQEEALALAKRQ